MQIERSNQIGDCGRGKEERLLRGAAGSRRDGAGAEGGHGGWLCRSRAQGFRHRPHPRPPGPDAVLPRKDTWGPLSLSRSVHLTLHPGADLLPSFCPGALPRSQPDAQVGASYPSPQPLLVPETKQNSWFLHSTERQHLAGLSCFVRRTEQVEWGALSRSSNSPWRPAAAVPGAAGMRIRTCSRPARSSLQKSLCHPVPPPRAHFKTSLCYEVGRQTEPVSHDPRYT